MNDEYPALTEKALQMIIPFATSYLCEASFSAMAVIKTEYRTRISVERDIQVAVSKILRRFDELCKNKQAHTTLRCRPNDWICPFFCLMLFQYNNKLNSFINRRLNVVISDASHA